MRLSPNANWFGRDSPALPSRWSGVGQISHLDCLGSARQPGEDARLRLCCVAL
jgi:hypothetical protein